MAMFQANTSGSYGSHYFLRLYIDELSYDIPSNTSLVRYRLVLYFDGSSYYSYINNTTSGRIDAAGQSTPGSIGSISYNSGIPREIELMSTQRTIQHNADGTGRADAYGYWNTNTSRMGSGEVSGGIDLTKIPRYANITEFRVENAGLGQVRYIWQADAQCDFAWYSTDNGNSWYGLPTTNIISNLTPNATYNFKLRLRRKDSQLTTDSNTITLTLFDQAKITSLPNFVHGDNINIGITNPSNISTLSLTLSVNNIQIFNKNVSTGNNSISLTDSELDTLYKQYSSTNTLQAKFTLNGGGYSDSKECTVTLEGNQKTGNVNVQNSWKRTKRWINVNGVWKKAVRWINVNGVWKRCI